MTLTEFLLARIAEDEEIAQTAEASGGDPASTAPIWTSLRSGKNGICDHGPRGSVEMSPARVLAECEAKRRIVELAQRVEEAEGGGAAIVLFDGYRAIHPNFAGAWGVLPALAAVYADHPDYRDEWKP